MLLDEGLYFFEAVSNDGLVIKHTPVFVKGIIAHFRRSLPPAGAGATNNP
jgi:hypothetical protein